MLFHLWVRILSFILQPRWIAYHSSDCNRWELGLSVWGVTFSLYKGEVFIPRDVQHPREPLKREFGESLHPADGYRQCYDEQYEHRVQNVMDALTDPNHPNRLFLSPVPGRSIYPK